MRSNVKKIYQIVGDVEKSDESQTSVEIHIIPTLVSPPVVHDDHERAWRG